MIHYEFELIVGMDVKLRLEIEFARKIRVMKRDIMYDVSHIPTIFMWSFGYVMVKNANTVPVVLLFSKFILLYDALVLLAQVFNICLRQLVEFWAS